MSLSLVSERSELSQKERGKHKQGGTWIHPRGAFGANEDLERGGGNWICLAWLLLLCCKSTMQGVMFSQHRFEVISVDPQTYRCLIFAEKSCSAAQSCWNPKCDGTSTSSLSLFPLLSVLYPHSVISFLSVSVCHDQIIWSQFERPEMLADCTYSHKYCTFLPGRPNSGFLSFHQTFTFFSISPLGSVQCWCITVTLAGS